MTLLQTRVEEREAKQFASVARRKGHTAYSLLQSLVKGEIAAAAPVEPWQGHAERLARLNKGKAPLSHNAVANARQQSNER